MLMPYLRTSPGNRSFNRYKRSGIEIGHHHTPMTLPRVPECRGQCSKHVVCVLNTQGHCQRSPRPITELPTSEGGKLIILVPSLQERVLNRPGLVWTLTCPKLSRVTAQAKLPPLGALKSSVPCMDTLVE